jgi:hypothetical protein
MSRAAIEGSARVVLDGVGGDHLFSVSGGAELSDHLFMGRWRQVMGAWQEWGAKGPRRFLRLALLPYLSRGTLDWMASLRGGRRFAGFWDGDLPPWIMPAPGVVAQLVPETERGPTESAAAYETRRVLTMPLVARALSWNQGITSEEGVSIRSPLMDGRLIRFAAGRPLNERGAGPDSKLILRNGMRGLIPTKVLQVRGAKTGLPTDYFRRQLQPVVVEEVRRLFGKPESVLSRLGLLRQEQFTQVVAAYADTGGHWLGAKIHITLEVERWLAARVGKE